MASHTLVTGSEIFSQAWNFHFFYRQSHPVRAAFFTATAQKCLEGSRTIFQYLLVVESLFIFHSRRITSNLSKKHIFANMEQTDIQLRKKIHSRIVFILSMTNTLRTHTNLQPRSRKTERNDMKE